MRFRFALALSLAVFSSGCSAGSTTGRSSTGVGAGAGEGGTSSVPSAAGDASDPVDAANASVLGGGGCPARADAAACPAPPAGFGYPGLPPTTPAVFETDYWVGCGFTNCSSQTSCTTCTCVDDDGGVWQCASNDGFQFPTDAAIAPYCALNSGPLDAAAADAGPVEQCTSEYPTCTGPFPESPGWQCCRSASVGGVTELDCMPNDAAAYSGGPVPPSIGP
jgi:hypothetical protein